MAAAPVPNSGRLTGFITNPRNRFTLFKNAMRYFSPKAVKYLDDNDMKRLYASVRTPLFDKKLQDALGSGLLNSERKEELYQNYAQHVLQTSDAADSTVKFFKMNQDDFAARNPGKELPVLEEADPQTTTGGDFMAAGQVPAGQAVPSPAEQETLNRGATTPSVNTATAGEYVPGLGLLTAGGQLSRGVVENVGGGRLNTVVSTEEGKGDFISQGPRSVESAKQTLRPKFMVAGGEDVRPTIQADAQSNALFESFSIVPDGYGLGPENRLHLLNRQNDTLRFGAESLYEPRPDAPIAPARPIPAPWKESMSLKELEEAYATKIGMEFLKARGLALVERGVAGFVLEDDMNLVPSSKTLPRQERGPSPFTPVVTTSYAGPGGFNLEEFLPARDPPGMQMNSLARTDTLRGAMGYRRKRVFDSLMG